VASVAAVAGGKENKAKVCRGRRWGGRFPAMLSAAPYVRALLLDPVLNVRVAARKAIDGGDSNQRIKLNGRPVI
jgi:hypothetical protein